MLKLVAEDGDTLLRSFMVTIPTSLFFAITGNLRTWRSCISSNASAIEVSGDTIARSRLILSLTFTNLTPLAA
jgi:hypothetical protein